MTDAPDYPPPPTDAQLSALPGLAPGLAAALRAMDFTVAGFARLLGDAGLAALDRGEPEAVARLLRPVAVERSHADSALARLMLAIVVGDPVDLSGTLGRVLYDASVDAAILAPAAGGASVADGVVATIDIRPLRLGSGEHLVFSDRDASMRPHVPGADHVLGVGRASRSLLDITPDDPAGAVLDLGCGGGVQALGQLGAETITATDVHPRSLLFARATLAAADRPDAEVLEGSWFEPVAGRRFDRIVANPPFVVSPPEVTHVYRDSGLDLDGATRLMLEEAAGHLKPGGTAHLLGAWAITGDGEWPARLASWVPAEGVEAWVVQRDVADAESYVATWLRDESIDPRSAAGRERTRRWLDHFAGRGVTGVGFGYITLQAIEGQSSVVCEEMPQPLGGPFAPEAAEYLIRAAWLRDRDADGILNAAYRVRPGVAIERVTLADGSSEPGFAPAALRVTRTDGPRWSHDIDDPVASLLGALQPGAPLRTVVSLLHMFGAFGDPDDVDAAAVAEAAVPVIVDLIRHGIVLPAELTDTEEPNQKGEFQ